MSLGELLVILMVALIVFGPNKLPMLAKHLGQLFRYINRLKQQVHHQFSKLMDEQQLLENEQKAKTADDMYKKDLK